MYVLVLRHLSCPTLCEPTDCSRPGFSVHGIFQARILEWIATSSFRDLPDPGIEHMSLRSPALAGGFFTTEPPGKPIYTYIHTYVCVCIYIYMYIVYNVMKNRKQIYLNLLSYYFTSLSNCQVLFYYTFY